MVKYSGFDIEPSELPGTKLGTIFPLQRGKEISLFVYIERQLRKRNKISIFNMTIQTRNKLP